MHTFWRLPFLASLVLPSFVGQAAVDTHFRSPEERVALVELYTSEGCSSCPPAESWLSELRSDQNLWTKFVPIAFHVSYWDSLGWRDPFSSKELTQRQYALAAIWSAPNVYTPCFVLNGEEWHPQKGELTRGKKDGRSGVLEANWKEGGNCQINFTPTSPAAKELRATVALLGGDISSAVRAGENSGRTLRHDFVAIQLVTVKLEKTSGGVWTGEAKLTKAAPASVKKRALAAWIVEGERLEPLQSVGGWLD